MDSHSTRCSRRSRIRGMAPTHSVHQQLTGLAALARNTYVYFKTNSTRKERKKRKKRIANFQGDSPIALGMLEEDPFYVWRPRAP
ncbi:hypothetical protein POX_e06452 [Penicillium oxalicum]|uniref:Uncharacterized protein n=1 Tax=Penicillium oxalicum (strain 114-2 / CGMCC 5302) TaxID=933388 RepID=S8AZP6_PENO1|nr:hypothetical protein POX_e06452 [Penicillium oxalicum]EPS27487.1 hypothetical protein PDE_02430 [Penicillium oxalicum 114-2]KAI2788436.1 hypothetical protein POX_e06452 [Penicillium oxalicum]